MKPWRPTRRAERSLVEISAWTINQFGERQAIAYRDALTEGIDAIAAGQPPRPRPCSVLLRGHSGAGQLVYYREGGHYIGRTREALPYIEAAIDQDPVNGRNFAMLSVAHLNLGNLDAAVAAGQRMVDLGMPSMWLAVATAAMGDPELAVEQYRQTWRLTNRVIFPPAGTEPLTGQALEDFWQLAAMGVCSGRPKARTAYCAMLDNLHAALPDPCDTSIVMPAIWMGYAEMVFKTLGDQITPANMFCLMSLWADIEPVRQTRPHPEFLAFAERISLVATWEKYGRPDLLPQPEKT